MPSHSTRLEPTDRGRRRHDLSNTVTDLRLRTQLLRRFAAQQDHCPAWQRMADGLAALDTDITRLLCQLEEDERR